MSLSHHFCVIIDAPVHIEARRRRVKSRRKEKPMETFFRASLLTPLLYSSVSCSSNQPSASGECIRYDDDVTEGVRENVS